MLSAAVLVIVIDARAAGLAGMARVGDLTETRRHGGFGGGMARGGGHGKTRMARKGDRWCSCSKMSCSCVRHVSLFVSVGANPTPEVVVHREAV